jgi:methionyl-tRNA formyltransferase
VRTVFLGSGPFAIPILEAVARHPRLELVAVVTAPPRPAGRGHELRPSPVAGWVEGRRGAQGRLPFTLLEPPRLGAPEAVATLRSLEPELIVLADYGQIVPAELLEVPRHGALNLHPSLLPRHRGASPIPATILAGDRETGVSLIRMDAGVDTGPIVALSRQRLRGDETAPELEGLLARKAAQLLGRSLKGWLEGRLAERPQPSEGATVTRPFNREDGRIDPQRSAEELARQVRAFQPWPGSFIETGFDRLIVLAAESAALPEEIAFLAPGAAATDQPPVPTPPGTFVPDGEGIALVASDGLLRLLEVQPSGGRRMTGAELRRGRPGLVGSRALPAALG